jgi:hypothetical protein
MSSATVRLCFNSTDSYLLSNLQSNITFHQLLQDVKFKLSLQNILVNDVSDYTLQHTTKKKVTKVNLHDRLDNSSYLQFYTPVFTLELKPAIDHKHFIKLFGAPLEFNCHNPVHRGFESRGYPIPRIVLMSIDHLNKSGTDVEGIFRVNGSATTVNNWKKQWDSGEYTFYEFESKTIPNDVASLLKQYLRELPESLVPSSMRADFKQLFGKNADVTSEDEKIKKINDLFTKLTNGHFTTLELLIQLCHKIKQNVSVTKMNAENLATCLTPSIFADKQTETKDVTKMMESVQESNTYAKAVTFIINNYEQLFKRTKTIEEFHRDHPNTGTLVVEVIGCTNLVAADNNKSSDPYVKVKLYHQKVKTRTVKKDLNPTFYQQFEIAVLNAKDDVLLVMVNDWDHFTRADEIGEVSIPIHVASEKRVPHRVKLPLEKVQQGEIELILTPLNYGE